MENISFFVEELKEYMLENNLNIREIADEVGCSKTCIANWLRHNIFPTIQSLVKLADFFDCSIDYLVGIATHKSFTRSKSPATFQEIFGELLDKHNITLYRLSKETNLAEPRMTKWKLYNQTPTIDSLIVLANYFNCSIDYLIGRAE